MAEIRALRYAKSSGTGLSGYYKGLNKYDQGNRFANVVSYNNNYLPTDNVFNRGNETIVSAEHLMTYIKNQKRVCQEAANRCESQ